MNIPTIVFSLLLVGVPACTGTYFVIRYFGSQKVSAGIFLLLLAFGVTFTRLYLLPQTMIGGGDYFMVMPWMLGVSIVVGAALGLLARRDKK